LSHEPNIVIENLLSTKARHVLAIADEIEQLRTETKS
jgi:hypothetical protein